jgi:hypothetical protein
MRPFNLVWLSIYLTRLAFCLAFCMHLLQGGANEKESITKDTE